VGTDESAARPIRVVVVTHDSAAVLPGLLDSLEAGMEGTRWRLVAVDNDSRDDTRELLRRSASAAQLIELDRNLGYAAAVNRALADARGEIEDVLLLNPDVRLSRGSAASLQRRLRTASHLDSIEGRIGLTAPLCQDSSGAVLPTLRREPTVARALAETVLGVRRAGRRGWGEAVLELSAYARTTTADWISGAALMISSECLHACGEWDERFFLYSEDTDYALRARDEGFLSCLEPEAEVVHLGGASRADSRLWALLAVNKVILHAKRHGRGRAIAFRSAALLRELRLALSGNRPSRRAAVALLGRAPTEIGGPR